MGIESPKPASIMDTQLCDKVALVTGGGGGVGAAICRALSQEGVRVAVADRDESAAQRVAAAIGGFAVAMDVADGEGVEAGMRRVMEEWGVLHIVVSNVGLTLPDYLTEVREADVDKTFDVNMRGALHVTRAAVPPLRAAGWGRLIYIGSSSGLKASAGLALYSASKYFLHGLAVAAGLELGRDRITANILCPSDIYPEGELPAGSWRGEKLVQVSLRKEGVADLEELKTKRIQKIPAGRGCRVEDVANAAVFLASPLADFINAQAIGINGGALPN
jgi:NAD(P)-dependent dehydrogenase (short-subunit alcohol dehydrogenase family)